MSAYTLRLCGPVEARDPHGELLEALVRQPKRLLLLAHLVLCSSEGCVRRDSLTALFWPEADQERARHNLRQALYVLRSHLGDDVLIGQGVEEVRIDLDRLWCDVPALETALTTGRLRDAQALYQGDLLDGVYAEGVSSQLEQILDARRARLKERVAEAAWELAEEGAAAGDALEVHHWGRRAVELSREVESAYRRLIVLLDWVGDAGAAMVVHEDLVERLENDLGVAPSPETTKLVERLRNRSWARAETRTAQAAGHTFYELPARARPPSERSGGGGAAAPDEDGSYSTENYSHVLGIGFILLAIAVLILTVLVS